MRLHILIIYVYLNICMYPYMRLKHTYIHIYMYVYMHTHECRAFVYGATFVHVTFEAMSSTEPGTLLSGRGMPTLAFSLADPVDVAWGSSSIL